MTSTLRDTFPCSGPLRPVREARTRDKVRFHTSRHLGRRHGRPAGMGLTQSRRETTLQFPSDLLRTAPVSVGQRYLPEKTRVETRPCPHSSPSSTNHNWGFDSVRPPVLLRSSRVSSSVLLTSDDTGPHRHGLFVETRVYPVLLVVESGSYLRLQEPPTPSSTSTRPGPLVLVSVSRLRYPGPRGPCPVSLTVCDGS